MPFWLDAVARSPRLLFSSALACSSPIALKRCADTASSPHFRAAGRLARLLEAPGRPFPWPLLPQPPPTPAVRQPRQGRNQQPPRARARQSVFNSLPRLHGQRADICSCSGPWRRRAAPYLYGLTLCGGRAATLSQVGPSAFPPASPLHGENCIVVPLPQEKSHPQSAALKARKRFFPPPPAQARHVHHPRVRRHVR